MNIHAGNLVNDVLFLCDFPIAILSFTNLLPFLAINLRKYNVVYVIPCIAYGCPERWVAEAKKISCGFDFARFPSHTRKSVLFDCRHSVTSF